MKLSLTYDDIAKMANEAVSRIGRHLLSEISTRDAYSRFYDGKIPPEYYEELMNGTDCMTPYHKLCLDKIISVTKGIDDWTGDWWTSNYVSTVQDIWNGASLEGRQLIVRLCKEEYKWLVSKKCGDMLETIGKYARAKNQTVKAYEDNGLVVLYENKNVKITCTTTYSSSCHFYGRSHWCTASDRSGRWDGLKMFDDYADSGALIQFYDKNREENSIQVCLDQYGKQFGICDWFDKKLTWNDMMERMHALWGLNANNIVEKVIKPKLGELVNLTKENLAEEKMYYNIQDRREARAFHQAMKGKIMGKEAADIALRMFNEERYIIKEDDLVGAVYEEFDDGKVWVIIVSVDDDTMRSGKYARAYGEFKRNPYEYRLKYGESPAIHRIFFVRDGRIMLSVNGYINAAMGRLALISDTPDYRCDISYVVDIYTGRILKKGGLSYHYTLSDTEVIVSGRPFISKKAEELSAPNEHFPYSRQWFAIKETRRDLNSPLLMVNIFNLNTFWCNFNGDILEHD